MKEYIVVNQRVEGNPDAGFETCYYSDRRRFAGRLTALKHGYRQNDSDDFNIATLDGNRIVAFGFDDKDFGPDEHGTPHGGYDLDEIAAQIGLT